MESTQCRKEQSPGSTNRGGGKVCRRCGWVYPNAHPGKKHRQAHQKRCRAIASLLEDDAGNVAAGVVDVSVGPRDLLAEENRGGKCGEEMTRTSVPEGEEGKDVRDMSPSGGDGEEMVKNTILEIAFVENSHKPYALDHGNMVQSPNEEPIETQAESSICLQSHSVSCGAHVVYASEDSNFVFCSTSADGSLLAAPEEMDCATVQSILDTPITVTPCDFSLTADRASPVNVQVANLVHEVPENAIESKLAMYNSQDMKSDVAKEVSQTQPSCKDGAFTSETNTDGVFDVSAHSSGGIHQDEKSVNSLLIINKLEDSHTLPLASTSCMVEASDVNPGSLEDYGSSCSDGLCSLENNAGESFNISTHFSGCDNQNSNASVNGSEPEDCHSSPVVSKVEAFVEEPDLTKPCDNAEVGENIDKNVNGIPSIISIDEEFSFYRETFDGNKTNELKANHNYKNVNSGIQLANELEHEVAVPIVNFQGPKEEMDQHQRGNRVTSVELSVDQARDIDNLISDSCETDYSAIEKEANKLESLSKGLDAYEYCGPNLTNADSSISRFNVSSLLNIESQIDRQTKTLINNNVMSKEEIHEMGQEGSYSMDPKSCSLSISYPFILMPPHGDESEKTDLLNRNGAISLKQHYISSSEIFKQSGAGNQTIDHSDRKAETFVLEAIAESGIANDGISSSYSHSVSDCYSDQPHTQEIPEEGFKQPAACDETIDRPDGKALITVLEATSESAIHGRHSYGLDVHTGGTNNMETILLSQLKRDVHEIAKIDLLNSDKNNPDSLFVANTDVHIAADGKENTCCRMHMEESNAGQCSEVCFFPEGGESITTEAEKRSTIHSLAGKPPLDPHPKISHHIEVTSNNFDQPSKEENVHIECMEQTQSSGGKLDDMVEPMEQAGSSNKKTLDSVKENIETCSIRALRSMMPEGAIPSMGSAIEAESNLDVASSPPTNSLTAKELLSDLAAADAFQGNIDIFDMLEISLTTLVESGRRSVTIENTTAEIRKQEFGKSNSIDENTANLLDLNFGQPQAMLKNLLAEAQVESKQKLASGQDYTAVLSSKRIRWDTENDGHALEPATPKTVSERSNELLGNQAYHKEWNSPARLPVTKHDKKKVKRRQAWIPFICCASIH